MANILDKIKEYKLKEVEYAQKSFPLPYLMDEIVLSEPPISFLKALQETKYKYGIIAEIKKASPSKGIIRNDFNHISLAKSYQNGGATCLSILTDKPSFQGDNKYLSDIKKIVDIPCLRKDFIFTPYQIFESRSLGADCILLIMACLEDNQAKELEKISHDIGMDVLVEVHNKQELERAQKHLKSKMIGINNRNLKTFETDLNISKDLSSMVDKDKIVVCESGLYTAKDLEIMASYNMTSFLIGESLMRKPDVGKSLQELLD